MTTLARNLLIGGFLLASALAARAETVFWFDDGLYPVENQTNASYRLSVADERDGIGWPAELRRIRDDALRMRGYVAKPEAGDTDATWIGHYELHRMDGEHRLAEVGTTDAQARQQGLTTTFDEQGLLDSESLYRDGELDGTARKYLHGQIYSTTDYKNGQRDGVHVQYVQGKLRRIEEYHNDKLDGVTEQYTIGVQPELTSRSHYRHGEPHGWFRQYQAGATVSEIHYVDGKKNGPERYWHDQDRGQLREVAYFRDGRQVGERVVNRYDVDSRVTVQAVFDADTELLAKTEYEDGQPKTRVRHVTAPDGSPREIHEYFDDHGYIYARRTLFPGQAHEIEVRFDGEGKLFYQRELRNHHRVGRFYEADENHRTTTIQYDDQGRRHGGEYETLDGKPLRATTWVHGTRQGPFIEIAYNGQQSLGTYADGRRDGVFRVSRDGQLIERIHYDHGTKHGAYERYDDATLLERGNYVNGARQGAWIESAGPGRRWQGRYDHGLRVGTWHKRNESGYPVEIGDYDDGEPVGLWTLYADNGQLRDCPFYRDGTRVSADADHKDSQADIVAYCKRRREAGRD